MPTYVFDCECYRDFFMVAFRDIDSGMTWHVEMHPGVSFPITQLPPGTLVSFNGNNYDIPMLSLAMAGADCEALKYFSDLIIIDGMKPWAIPKQFKTVDLSGIDHIDLIEVAPGIAGLKIYGGRLNSRRLQDLPIEPGASISPADRIAIAEYCRNDLQTTIDLYRKLEPQIELRKQMSREFGIDLRSKSDAQIAEAVIRSEVERRLGKRVFRPEIHPTYQFNYKVPEWVSFHSDGMRKLLEVIRAAEFTINKDGGVDMPPMLESMRIRIGDGVYRMGIGGLHSSESCISHVADELTRLVDRDVTSYYPSIILNQGLFPSHLGPDFLEVYRSLVERRIAAKHAGDKVMADALKICVNGSFGKLGSKWSVLYSPDLLIQVTLTGQLALLMLIESLETAEIRVISANTDGVVSKVPRARNDEFNAILTAWELTTGFATEETEYSALYSRDVNNYIAVKPDGKTKTKGAYATGGLQKNPANEICTDAVIAFLTDGTPIEQTILSASDVRKFVTVRQVKGGSVFENVEIGKAVRWIYSTHDDTSVITYKSNGNKVARSEGARPLMELPETIPPDINYDWYIREAESILHDIGM